MSVVDIYLSLGSNLGDRDQNIHQALNLLEAEMGKPYEAISSIIESKSWGFEGYDFLNCVVKYRSDVDPYELLKICKKIENILGRKEILEYDASGRRIYHNRPIDIDILLYGDKTINTELLTIPHPQMKNRDFIMGPLMEIYR